MFLCYFRFLVVSAMVSEGRQLVTDAPRLQQRPADKAAHFPPLASRANAIREAKPHALLMPLSGSLVRYTQSAFSLIVDLVMTIALAFSHRGLGACARPKSPSSSNASDSTSSLSSGAILARMLFHSRGAWGVERGGTRWQRKTRAQ